jgi:hypothetical protein
LSALVIDLLLPDVTPLRFLIENKAGIGSAVSTGFVACVIRLCGCRSDLGLILRVRAATLGQDSWPTPAKSEDYPFCFSERFCQTCWRSPEPVWWPARANHARLESRPDTPGLASDA